MQYSKTIRRAVQWAAISALAFSVFAPLLSAQVSNYGDKQMGPANTKSRVLDKVGIAQNLNQQLPLCAYINLKPVGSPKIATSAVPP